MREIQSSDKGRIAYLIVLLVAGIFTAIGFFSVKNGQIYENEQLEEILCTPVSVENRTDGSTEYILDVDGQIAKNDYLIFYTNHQIVNVYEDGELVYKLEAQDTVWGHSTGSVWNMVPVSEDAKTICIDVARVYSEMENLSVTFYLGDGMDYYRDIIKTSFGGVFTSTTIFVVGVCLLLFWLGGKESRKKIMDVLYLGVFLCLFGVWSFGETQTAMLIMDNRVMASYIGYSCLNFICIPFIMFIRYFLHMEEKYLYKLYIAWNAVEWLTCQILQIAGVIDVRQLAWIVHATLGLGFLYVTYAIIVTIKQRQYIKQAIISIVGIATLVVTYGIDLVFYYKDSSHVNQGGVVGFMAFVIIFTYETTIHSRKSVKEDRMMALYKEMAVKDMLTQCYNRNAFAEDMIEYEKMPLNLKRKLVLVTFDLNNLKACNDSLGHKTGDQYIMDAASCIRSHFEKHGRTYRIGGDEFCVVSRSLSKERVWFLCNQIEHMEFHYVQNQENVCKIATGYAQFDESLDTTLEDTRSRADALMYENKNKIKEDVERKNGDRIRRILQ